MAVAGPARTMGTWKVTNKGDMDELESDVDHHEMIKAYACDAYLSKWLPDINHSHATNIEDNGTISNVEQAEQEVTREKRPTSLDSIPKTPPSQNPQQERGGDDVMLRDTKVTKEARRKTYFEAIKCSPIKLRRSIVTQKITAPKEENITKRFSFRQAAKDKNSWATATNDYLNSSLKETSSHSLSMEVSSKERRKTRSTMTPCVVEMTGGPLGELGSLCFKTKDADRRHNDAVYTSLAGGKMRKLHRNKIRVSGRTKNDLLLRCESVMIYPKVLVNPKTEKTLMPKPTLFYPKEAWNDAVPSIQRPLSNAKTENEDVTKLPNLPEKEIDGRSEQNPEGEKTHQGPKRSPNSGTSTKIIVPFGEDEAKLSTDSSSHSNTQNTDKSPENPTNTSCKEQHANRKIRPSRFSELSLRKVPGMVIGVTQLELPRRTALATEHVNGAVKSRSPIKKLQLLNTDVSDLYLGNENVPPSKSVSPRYLFSPRKRMDFARKSMQGHTHCGLSDDEQENSKSSTGRDKDLSLQIGGTGLLKESGSLKENFDRIKQIEEKKRVHFNVLVPHSRYFT